jgi:hypothetical protein
MKHAEKATPIAAALTALSTLLCCLPVGFAAAGAAASLSIVIAPYQSWLIGASIVLLGVGVVQLRHAQRTCATRGSASLIILAVSATVVVLVVLFPQLLAGVVADWLS